MDLKLFHHPTSTCSQKVRIAVAEKGLIIDQQTIDWSVAEHLSDWYLAINPNGVVPTLVHDGNAVLDSSVICEYLDEAFGDRQISPHDASGRAEMRAWMRYFEEVPTAAIRVPSFNKLFLKVLKTDRSALQFEKMTERMPLRSHFYRQMGPQGFPEQMEDESLDRLRKSLRRVADRLADGRPYLLGSLFSIADIVFIPTVVRMEDLGLASMWRDLPVIQRWFEQVQSRPSFLAAYLPGSRVYPANS